MRKKKTKKSLIRKKKAAFGEEKLVQSKVIRTFKSGDTPKFEPLKTKQKFESLKADELKFVHFKSKRLKIVL